ncbi:Solute carrier family 40 member 1 [Lamellibrachia satsuma]|nr:Solute carrier family 40 member 1 [Lamellibrachia satsuma]
MLARNKCPAANSACAAVISACIASDLSLFEGMMLARNKCPTVNLACAAVISACLGHWLRSPKQAEFTRAEIAKSRDHRQCYIYENGLSEVMVGLAMSLGGLTGVLGSYAFTWFRRRIGLERTGLIAFNLELACLTLCVASIWAPGSVFEPTSLFQPHHTYYTQNCSLVQSVGNASHVGSDVTAQVCGETAMSKEKISIALFLVGIITSRVGLWMADLVVTQLLQETVQERERGIVNGVQHSLNMLMDVMKFTLVIVLPNIETFGYLIILSFIFICLASLFFTIYACSACHTGIADSRSGDNA